MSCSLYITVGIPGSGKTTGVKDIVEKTDATVICPDDIREEVSGDASDQSQNEKVWKIAYARLHKSLENGKSVVFDATSVYPKARKPLIKVGKQYNCEIVACVFPVTLQTAIDRQKGRDRQVPAEVIERFYDQFKMPSTSEGFDKVFVYNK
jgi:predicted kinase